MAESVLKGMPAALDQDKKRARDARHKWAGGVAEPWRGSSKRQPYKGLRCGNTGCQNELDFHKCRNADRHHPRVRPARCDNSNASDIQSEDFRADRTPSPQPEPDAQYTYSYDAQRGPSEGSQVLGVALAKAVDKYETKATEKLVKTEYEIVDEEKEDSGHSSTSVEDDFELV